MEGSPVVPVSIRKMHQNGWVIMENPVEMDDLMIWGTPTFEGNLHMRSCTHLF